MLSLGSAVIGAEEAAGQAATSRDAGYCSVLASTVSRGLSGWPMDTDRDRRVER
jgi:hypothetical protein